MFEVSDAYKLAMKKPVQKHALKGTIGDFTFTDINVLSGSFSITNQCSGNDAIEIGQVYVGELSATFLNVPLDRYKWKGTTITPYFGMGLEDGSFEYIPLGVFTIDTAEWTSSGVVVKAYDNMSLLDGTCNKTITEVTAFDCAKRIAEETGVTFANTEDEFKAFPNGNILMSETTTNDVETWRDLVSWLAQTLCCFATCDRYGNIVFKQYKDEVDDTIDDKHRFTGASFSDFVTRYTGLSVVNMADSKTNYYGLEVDDGLTMNLGSNPFLQYGIEDTKEQMRKAILNGLTKINYVPFKVKAIGNPCYDLGDVLVFSDGLADGSKKYCITKYVFNYHGNYEMTGVGQDPALSSAKSKTDKNISGLISNTDENTLVHYQFSNTKVVEIADGAKETVASIRFATATKDSEVSMWAELLIDTTNSKKHVVNDTVIDEVTVSDPPLVTELQSEIEASDKAIEEINTRVKETESVIANPNKIKAKISYMLNGSELDYHPKETFAVDEEHIISLNYYIGNVKANTIYNFVISLEMEGGSAYFDMNTINVVLTGMGLAGTGSWDGTITVEDKFVGFEYKTITSDFKETVNTEFKNINNSFSPSDVFSLDFRSIVGMMHDSTDFEEVVKYYILSNTEGKPSYNNQYLILNSDNAFVLNTDYMTEGSIESVDEGFLQVLDIYKDYDELMSLEEATLK